MKLLAGCQMIVDTANEYLDSTILRAVKDEKKPVIVLKETFLILKFKQMQGERLGTYGVAYQSANIEDKWRFTYPILQNLNATIKTHYHSDGYKLQLLAFQSRQDISLKTTILGEKLSRD